MKLTITAAIHARWGHRVDGLIHTHAWTVEATLTGPADCDKVFPADDLERILLDSVAPWQGHYLTDTDVGNWPINNVEQNWYSKNLYKRAE